MLRGRQGLREGDNTVAVLVWYFGKDGFSHRNSPTPGLAISLSVDGRALDTDNAWRVCRHPAYYLPEGEKPNYRLPESNIGFDATKDIAFHRPDYDDGSWSKARRVSLEEGFPQGDICAPLCVSTVKMSVILMRNMTGYQTALTL